MSAPELSIHSERDPLLPTASQSSKRVTLQIPEDDGSVGRKPPPSPKAPSPAQAQPSFKAGICIMLFITFLSSICFSIILPSIWPYLHDEFHADKSMVGWAVAVNSLGSFLASPLFGWWLDKRSTREVIVVSLMVMVIGNVMYSLAVNVWMLLAGRFVVGVAAANYAVAQTYLSYATSTSNRTMVMALNSAATVLGFVVGPAFALVLSYVQFDFHGVVVNNYTSPGYLSAILSVLSMFSLVLLKEIPASVKKKKQPLTSSSRSAYGSGFYSGQGSIKDVSMILRMGKQQKMPVVPVLLCLYCYFAYTTSFTVFETIGTPYTLSAFGWGIRENSLMYIGLGGVCIGALMTLQIFVRFFNDRILLMLTTVLAACGFGAMFDPYKHFVPLWRFWIGVSLCSASYATSVAVLISVYSKILEGLDQGMMMGWLSSAGSIARIIGPVVASYALQYGGQSGFLVFILMISLMSLTTIVTIAAYPALGPRGPTTVSHNKQSKIESQTPD